MHQQDVVEVLASELFNFHSISWHLIRILWPKFLDTHSEADLIRFVAFNTDLGNFNPDQDFGFHSFYSREFASQQCALHTGCIANHRLIFEAHLTSSWQVNN